MDRLSTGTTWWFDTCRAAKGIRDHFGLEKAVEYLVGEKLFSFVFLSEQEPEYAAELPEFVAEIRRIFTYSELQAYLDRLQRKKYRHKRVIQQEDPDIDTVWAVGESQRFYRIRELLD